LDYFKKDLIINENNYDRFSPYSNSKLCQILMTRELSKEFDKNKIIINSVKKKNIYN
jgi:NAD(P)-dependent dehydrogenase (short-subunit alcohol dehydrogenase family)